MTRYLSIAVVILGVVGLAMGIAFIAQGMSTQNLIAESLRAEKVTLELPKEGEPGYIEGNVVDTAAEAEAAQDILEEHLRERYGTYGDTKSGSPERTTYLAGTTLRNSLNLAVMGFGVSTVATVSGVFMVIVGIALLGTGLTLRRLYGSVVAHMISDISDT